MRGRFIPLLAIAAFLVGCQAGRLDDREMLMRCWSASPVSGARDEYRLRVEAIVIRAIEGGTFARTRACRDHRLGLTYERQDIRERFDRVGDSAVGQPGTVGAGIRAEVQVRVKERRTDYYMTVVVTEMFSFEEMSLRETRRFMREFNIG